MLPIFYAINNYAISIDFYVFIVKGSEVKKKSLKGHSAQIAEEEFAVMLSKLLTLLSTKYSKPEELQQLLVKCGRLTVTNETPYVFLVSTEQKMKFNAPKIIPQVPSELFMRN